MRLPTLWPLFHPRAIKQFKESAQVGAIIEHEMGERWEVTQRGDKGCWFKPLNKTEGYGAIFMLMGGSDRCGEWPYMAQHFRVVKSAGDAVADALREEVR